MAQNSQFVCTSCEFVGQQAKLVKGSILIEFVLWVFFILPGLIYSFWRLTSKQLVCPKCKHPTMIPVDSPMGQKLIGK